MAREKLGERMSVILDDETRREVSSAMEATGEKVAATLLRKAISKGLPLVRSGGDVVRLDGALSDFAGKLAEHYGLSRESILVEAIQRGIHSTQAHLLYKSTKEIPPEVAELMLRSSGEKEPLLREVQRAKIERGALEIQLDDLMRHCPDARERKEVIEKLMHLEREKRGSTFNRFGKGVGTEELKRQLADLELAAPTPAEQRIKRPEPPPVSEGALRRVERLPAFTSEPAASKPPNEATKSAPKKHPKPPKA